MHACACMLSCVCIRVFMRVCVCVCVRVCVQTCVHSVYYAAYIHHIGTYITLYIPPYIAGMPHVINPPRCCCVYHNGCQLDREFCSSLYDASYGGFALGDYTRYFGNILLALGVLGPWFSVCFPCSARDKGLLLC